MEDQQIDFLDVFNLLPGNFVILRPDTPSYTILAMSDALLQLTGRERQKVVGRSVFEVYPENEEAAAATGPYTLKSHLDKVVLTGQPDQMPGIRYDFVDRSGEFQARYWSASSRPVLNAAGEISYIIHTTRNITEEVLAKERDISILEIENTFQHLVQAPVAVGLFQGSDLITKFINPLACDIMGLKKEQIMHQPLFDVLPELQEQGLRDILLEVLHTGQPYEASEMPVSLNHGGHTEEKYFNVVYQAYRDQAGEILGIIQLVVEVTEQVSIRKKIEQSNQSLEEQVRLRTEELQKIRIQLETERNMLHTLLDQAPVAMCLFVGEDLKVASANQLMCDIWGRTASQVLHQPLLEGLPELQGQGFNELIRQVMYSGEPITGKEVAARMLRNGTLQTTYYNFVYQPMYDDQGKIIGVVDVAVEVTELVEARKKVEEREKLLQDLNQQLEKKVNDRTIQLEKAHQRAELQWKELYNLFEEAPVAIAVVKGSEYIIDLANQKVCDLWGRKQQEALNTPLFKLIPEAANQGFEELLAKVMETGESYVATEIPSQIKRHGRPETAYWNFVYHPFRNMQQKIQGVTVASTEVTEQVLARQKILESQKALRRFKFMADKAKDSFVLIRKDWTFAYANHHALLAWGYTEEEARHLRLSDIEPTFEVEPFARIFAEVQNKIIPPAETWHRRKNGDLFPVEVNAVGLEIEGEPFVFAISRDISERKKAEETLKQKNRELIHINNDLDNFIYTASHDLRTPITNIEGLLIILGERLPEVAQQDKGVQQIISMMDLSVSRFKKTIANLSDVVKLQKEQQLDSVQVDLGHIIREVRLDLQNMIRESGAEIEIDLSACSTLRFSKKNLRSIVYNLMSNAIKYRSPKRVPKIYLATESSPEYTILTVEDNGIGLSETSLNQLFSMFKRFNTHVEGTGIGLYMVKKMIDNAGGRIEVKSEEGKGTTFKVYIPQPTVVPSA